MKRLCVPLNRIKIFFSVIFLFTIVLNKAQAVQLQSLIVDEGLRNEILLVNNYIKGLRERKIISKEPIFIRLETGENPDVEFFNLRFLGNYYRNLSNNEELFYKVNNDIIYIFDISAVDFFKNFINFSLIRDNNNLQNYGQPKFDKAGITIEMGEISFNKSCGKFYLDLVTGMPHIDLYYKVKFSVARGSILYDTGTW